MEESQRFDWVPSALPRGVRHPDIRHHAVEPILVDLFPARSRGAPVAVWLQALRKMDERASKAFTFMLRAKQAVQQDMRRYLELRQANRAATQSAAGATAACPTRTSRARSPRSPGTSRTRESGGVRGEAARGEGRQRVPWHRTLLKPNLRRGDLQRSQDILKRVGGKHAAHDWMRLLLVKISQQPFETNTRARFWNSSSAHRGEERRLAHVGAGAPRSAGAQRAAGVRRHREELAVLVATATPRWSPRRAASRVGGDVPGRTGRAQSQGVRAPQDAVRGGHGGAGQARRANLAKLAAADGTAKDHLADVFERIVEDARCDDLLDSSSPRWPRSRWSARKPPSCFSSACGMSSRTSSTTC